MRGTLNGSHLRIGAAVFAAGCAWVGFDAIAWYASQGSFVEVGQGPALTAVLWFFLGEAVALGVAAAGACLIFRGLREAPGSTSYSARTILAEALASRSGVRIGFIAALLYAVVYLVASSVVVYQPSVDFGTAYGVTSPSLRAAVCCGAPGTVPLLIVYLAPQEHLALQVLPLDALFAVVVPLLVALNVSVAVHAVKNRALRANAGCLGSVGVMAGLFTGCPTCAGVFLAGALGGLGATSLAVALAPYQMAFVVVSIPVLLASPVVIARFAGRAVKSCAIPAASATQGV